MKFKWKTTRKVIMSNLISRLMWKKTLFKKIIKFVF